MIDGESLISSFVDPLQEAHGVVGGGDGAAQGGGGSGRGAEGEEEGEGEEEDAETSARTQVIKGLVANAGKLGERPKPPPPPEKKGVFGSLFGGGKK